MVNFPVVVTTAVFCLLAQPHASHSLHHAMPIETLETTEPHAAPSKWDAQLAGMALDLEAYARELVTGEDPEEDAADDLAATNGDDQAAQLLLAQRRSMQTTGSSVVEVRCLAGVSPAGLSPLRITAAVLITAECHLCRRM